MFNKRKEIPHINETGCLKRAKRLKFIYTNSFPKASKRKLELEIQILIFDNKILYLESEMKIPRDIANVMKCILNEIYQKKKLNFQAMSV